MKDGCTAHVIYYCNESKLCKYYRVPSWLPAFCYHKETDTGECLCEDAKQEEYNNLIKVSKDLDKQNII